MLIVTHYQLIWVLPSRRESFGFQHLLSFSMSEKDWSFPIMMIFPIEYRHLYFISLMHIICLLQFTRFSTAPIRLLSKKNFTGLNLYEIGSQHKVFYTKVASKPWFIIASWSRTIWIISTTWLYAFFPQIVQGKLPDNPHRNTPS